MKSINTSFEKFMATLGKHLLMTVILLLSFYKCKDKSTEPMTINPGKRDYVWTVDSLSYPNSYQTLMYDIWASSPKDVYVVGHNDQSGWGTVYRFDGSRWYDLKLSWTQGGPIQHGFSLRAIYGFGANNIYAVGRVLGWDIFTNTLTDSSLIIHYDGSSWSDMVISRKEELLCVTGYPPNKIWAGGLHGTIYYYDGNKFTIYELGNENYVMSIACTSPNEVYATINRFDYSLPIDSTGYFLFKFNGSTWKIIDSVMETSVSRQSHFGRQLWTDGKTLYSAGPDLYKYSGNSWIKLLEAPVAYVSKTRDNNMFAVGKYIYHYNGSDWKMLTPFNQSLDGMGVFATGDEVFLLDWYLDSAPQKTIILHGK